MDTQQTTIVNLRIHKYDVYIGRAGHGQDGYYGNPFPILPGRPRGSTIDEFRRYFYKRLNKDPEFKHKIHELKGKTLGCFCKPYPCHGDIYIEYLNTLPDAEDNTNTEPI